MPMYRGREFSYHLRLLATYLTKVSSILAHSSSTQDYMLIDWTVFLSSDLFLFDGAWEVVNSAVLHETRSLQHFLSFKKCVSSDF
jgi:hypothetical protein